MTSPFLLPITHKVRECERRTATAYASLPGLSLLAVHVLPSMNGMPFLTSA